MDKKLTVIIVLIIIVIISVIIGVSRNNNSKVNKINNSNDELIQTEIEYNDESHTYVVYDENGEIIRESVNREDLVMYTIDPEYDPKVEDENMPQEINEEY